MHDIIERPVSMGSAPAMDSARGRAAASAPQPAPQDETSSHNLISVIIPVYNEERYIGQCIESLLRQIDCEVEILVVDDGSTDRTPAILAEFAARDSRVRVLQQDHGGPGAARNLAAAAARGSILAFADGDMTFAPEYLAKLTAPIRRGEVIGTFSKEEYVANWDNVWARCWNLNDGITTNKRHPDDWPEQHEVFRAVPRAAFLAAQGFTSRGSGDDGTLASKLGALAHAAPGAVCYHYNPEGLLEAFRSARWYGRGRRVPATAYNFLVHTPPVSVARSVKRAWRNRLPHFIVFKIIVDLGTFIGLVEKTFRLAGLGR
jgi:glycosyltransferase involved in cell wall biosynthesis